MRQTTIDYAKLETEIKRYTGRIVDDPKRTNETNLTLALYENGNPKLDAKGRPEYRSFTRAKIVKLETVDA